MSWELFTSIVDQVPDVARVVLHGVGEPMMVKALPRMIRYLKDRGIYVLFNTNGTLLAPKKHQELIDTGLDELRVSLDAADAKTFLAVRGKNFFDRIVRNVRQLHRVAAATGIEAPRVSLWLTGLKETIEQLPAFVRLAATMGVREVHLQRLVYRRQRLRHGAPGIVAVRADARGRKPHAIEDAAALARDLGVTLDASGATEPGLSLKQQRRSAAVVRLPASLVADVFHRAWPRPAVLHRTVFRARLRQLHAGRRHPADAARDLERRGVSGLPRRAARRCAAEALRRTAGCAGACEFAVVARSAAVPGLDPGKQSPSSSDGIASLRSQ